MDSNQNHRPPALAQELAPHMELCFEKANEECI